VRVFGPRPGELSKLLGKSARLLTTRREKRKSRAAANLGSYVVNVEIGKFSGWFLGDATSRRTEQIVIDTARQSNPTNLCIKVAHHGANDGTSNRLLDAFSTPMYSQSLKHAMLTPFTKNALPRDEVLRMLKNTGFKTHISGRVRNEQHVREVISNECRAVTNEDIREASQTGDDVVQLHFPI
jgi:beta-lactamase superfamily II metal-dependent hydrolase